MNSKKIGLIILDGWGIGDKSKSDAIFNAKTPIMDNLLANYPSATLTTFGEDVGLPEGQMGNSEVGHLNIGAGRIVYQELTRINKSIREGDFFSNPVLVQAFNKLKSSGKKLHLLGLVSEGGVHSSQAHLHALCDIAKQNELEKVFVHAITDGRDCDPKSGASCIEKLEAHLAKSTGKIASIIGRYYAMDRDQRWERVKLAYDVLVNGEGAKFTNAKQAILDSYSTGITDEFILPHVNETIGDSGKIEEGDTVICFNFRTDRPREITEVLTQKDFPELAMKALKLDFLTMTSYNSTFKNIQVLFEKDNLKNTLGEVLSKMNRTQIRTAETEKYPHVTFFFNGGRETEFEGESRILVNSPAVATYDLQPEMSAEELKNKLIFALQEKTPDFFCLNFANPDMVGHTGIYDAIIKAVEKVDSCLGEIVNIGKKIGYEFLVIADHGNADLAINEDGTPNTAHTLNQVPVILISNNKEIILKDGTLADVAPTILDRMRIASPLEMSGVSLVKSTF